ncbi:metallophosphoesterase family protein [Sporosarcina cyprini]|uniref:metallophosphoesterase family protein n=1 Tax=Sporosarcina cyprini TaxID=2910523 RepID=UPI001EDFB3FA|nr:DNA repair exonuclease [Sporosarcina cyprini]MCG3088674.1 DNA repair exonuclease [Sporosarcina cyprini]
MSTIRFIHTADLHLGSPFKGMTDLPPSRLEALRNSTIRAFQRLIDYALASKPDFVLIVGDLYDGEDRNLRAQLKFQEGMEQLHGAGIPVLLSHGNHDHLGGTWTRVALPPNVHVFGDTVETVTFQVNGEDVFIHGFSYKERHVRTPMIRDYPKAAGNSLTIGMLHGSVAGDATHAVYAPFTKEELLEKQYDYWALGHIHLRQQLQEEPAIIYPGNIQGRHRNEKGMKGFYEVELSKSETVLRFVPTSEILFERVEVNCSGLRHANEWIQRCDEALETGETKRGRIVELVLTEVDAEAAVLFSQAPDSEWLEILREHLEENEPFVWIRCLELERRSSGILAAPNLMVDSIVSTMEDWSMDDWRSTLQEVYQHVRMGKYLGVLDETDVSRIKVDAEQLIEKEMIRGE